MLITILSHLRAIPRLRRRASPASPLLLGDRLYFTERNDPVLSCIHAKTGKVVFDRTRLNALNVLYGSPAAAAGRIYRREPADVLRSYAAVLARSFSILGVVMSAAVALVAAYAVALGLVALPLAAAAFSRSATFASNATSSNFLPPRLRNSEL